MARQFQEPLKAFRFLVELDGKAVPAAAFTGFSGIQMEVETISVRSGNDIRGVQEEIPIRTKFGPVTLTKGIVGDDDFLNWLFSVAAGPHIGSTSLNPYRNIDVVALDDQGNRSVIWTLYDALPVRYVLSPMDGGRSEVLSESITFAISGMDRKIIQT